MRSPHLFLHEDEFSHRRQLVILTDGEITEDGQTRIEIEDLTDCPTAWAILCHVQAQQVATCGGYPPGSPAQPGHA